MPSKPCRPSKNIIASALRLPSLPPASDFRLRNASPRRAGAACPRHLQRRRRGIFVENEPKKIPSSEGATSSGEQAEYAVPSELGIVF